MLFRSESAKEGSCGGKMVKEGKCGEGKCGGRMMEADTNKDGQISKTEFMAKHEAVFTEVDTNKDGMLDEKERQAMHGKMMKEGKCGEGKCGGKMKSHK